MDRGGSLVGGGGGGSLVLRATSGLGGTVDGGTVDGGTLVGVWGCSRWVWVKIGWGGGLGGQMGSCVAVKGGVRTQGSPSPSLWG